MSAQRLTTRLRTDGPGVGARLAAVLGLILGTACQTTEVRVPVQKTGVVQVGMPADCWEVLATQSEQIGLVVRFEGSDPQQTVYMVRNIWHQDLGLIDAFGRAYRYLPHHTEPAWVGTGTVREGVQDILGVRDCVLVEMPFAGTDGPVDGRKASPASASRRAGESPLASE